jgi:hypothetical protein
MTKQPCHTGRAAHVCGACAASVEMPPLLDECACPPGRCADGGTRPGCWMTECVRLHRLAEPIQKGCTICDPQLASGGPKDMCDDHRAEFYRWRAEGKPVL